MTAVMPAGVGLARDIVGPAMAAAVARLSPEVRRVSAYHLGMTDAEGNPRNDGAGKALRPALALLSARAARAASLIWATIWSSPTAIESSPHATENKCSAAAPPTRMRARRKTSPA